MRKSGLAFLAIAACAAAGFASPAFSAEQDITYEVDGQKVVGTLNIPDGAENPPVILLLHGFTGSRDELEIPSVKEGIFERAAHMWADRGLASLRIDFRGSGDSDGTYEDTTLQGQIKDALTALDVLAARDDVNGANMSVVGWSMGGTVGAAVAGRSEHPLNAVALWAPGTNLASAIQFLLGNDDVKKGLTAGDEPVTSDLPWGAQVTLKEPFFKSLFEVDPVAEITDYDGPLLVAVGSNDPVVFPQPESGQILLDYHEGPEELWVQPMDHSFNSFENHDTVDALIAKTGDFIEAAMN